MGMKTRHEGRKNGEGCVNGVGMGKRRGSEGTRSTTKSWGCRRVVTGRGGLVNAEEGTRRSAGKMCKASSEGKGMG